MFIVWAIMIANFLMGVLSFFLWFVLLPVTIAKNVWDFLVWLVLLPFTAFDTLVSLLWSLRWSIVGIGLVIVLLYAIVKGIKSRMQTIDEDEDEIFISSFASARIGIILTFIIFTSVGYSVYGYTQKQAALRLERREQIRFEQEKKVREIEEQFRREEEERRAHAEERRQAREKEARLVRERVEEEMKQKFESMTEEERNERARRSEAMLEQALKEEAQAQAKAQQQQMRQQRVRQQIEQDRASGVRTLKGGYLMAETEQILQRAMRYEGQGDTAAVNQLIRTGLVARSPEGARIHIVRGGFNYSKIRAVGDIHEVWIDTSAINR